MTRRKNNRNRCGGMGVYWQSAYYNERVFQMFYNQAMELAMSRFKWMNLPETCDARFLEYTLMTEGIASIAFPKRHKGMFYSTRMVMQGPPNVYYNPPRWRSVGDNGWNFRCSHDNGVVVFDNLMRYPVVADLEILARELADIMRTMQVNRLHQKIPYVMTGPEEQKLAMENIFKQIAGNEPAILGYDNLAQIKADKIDTQVPFIGKELQEALMNAWNLVYMRLGIKNIPFKTERQIEDEVTSMTEPSDLLRLSPLECRRAACDTLNRRFEKYLDEPVRVIWNNDNESENFNLTHNITDMLKALGGGDLDGMAVETDYDGLGE